MYFWVQKWARGETPPDMCSVHQLSSDIPAFIAGVTHKFLYPVDRPYLAQIPFDEGTFHAVLTSAHGTWAPQFRTDYPGRIPLDSVGTDPGTKAYVVVPRRTDGDPPKLEKALDAMSGPLPPSLCALWATAEDAETVRAQMSPAVRNSYEVRAVIITFQP